MAMDKEPEKRRFKRIPFDADVLLTQDKQQWRTKLRDISLNGVLVAQPDDWQGVTGEQFGIQIFFTNGGSLVEGQGTMAHNEQDHIGFRITQIDVDSVANLKRLIELNLGDPELLERELKELRWR